MSFLGVDAHRGVSGQHFLDEQFQLSLSLTCVCVDKNGSHDFGIT